MTTDVDPPLKAKRVRFRLRSYAIQLILLVAGIATLLAFGVRQAREAGRWSKCHCRLTQIGLALQNYESQYGTYPPAYQRQGSVPSSSWRLELTPFLDLQTEYDRYHRDELWNSPFNLALADEVAARHPAYRCPSAPTSQAAALANYVMPVGPNAFSPGPQGVKRAAIIDGTSNTIAVCEILPTDIYWTEPRDLDAGAMTLQLNAAGRPGISSAHPGGATVLFADGHTQNLPDATSPDVIKALLTIDGNEAVEPPRP